MSHLYQESPVKFPCSAYSIPMNLAAGVGFWDSDPQSMGEDFHMYLKCFFSTHGHVKVVTIYSPASCCNVQGKTWLSGVSDRFSQSFRHMWGSLDLGYAIRRSTFSLISPDYDTPYNTLRKVPLVTSHYPVDFSYMAKRLVPLLHRVFEAHVIMGQFILICITTALFIPAESGSSFAGAFWRLFSDAGVHPIVELALSVGFFIRPIFGLFVVAAAYEYERYQWWCGVERWKLSELEQTQPGSGQNVSHLGKRSKLVFKRTWLNVLDWLGLPISGFLYLTLPQVFAQCMQLFTDKLDYKVASKPTFTLFDEKLQLRQVITDTTFSTNLTTEKQDYRADSGFYEFEQYENDRLSPSMWKEKVKYEDDDQSDKTISNSASGIFA